MKDLHLLIWMTQLGVSVAIPPVLLILITQWLRDRWGLGDWIIGVGIALGTVQAFISLRKCLKAMAQSASTSADDPPASFCNDHF